MAIVRFLYVLCLHHGMETFKETRKSDFKNFGGGKTTLAVSIFKKGKSIIILKFYDFVTFIRYLTRLMKGKNPPWVHI